MQLFERLAVDQTLTFNAICHSIKTKSELLRGIDLSGNVSFNLQAERKLPADYNWNSSGSCKNLIELPWCNQRGLVLDRTPTFGDYGQRLQYHWLRFNHELCILERSQGAQAYVVADRRIEAHDSGITDIEPRCAFCRALERANDYFLARKRVAPDENLYLDVNRLSPPTAWP
ncbi:hypothetical protein [Piscinibacter sakaiensis]|uniref:hypothetical protein n=1 Tax=Piscinibacter sakaiensis TaxID=1547922 RepID=UPI003AAC05CF